MDYNRSWYDNRFDEINIKLLKFIMDYERDSNR